MKLKARDVLAKLKRSDSGRPAPPPWTSSAVFLGALALGACLLLYGAVLVVGRLAERRAAPPAPAAVAESMPEPAAESEAEPAPPAVAAPPPQTATQERATPRGSDARPADIWNGSPPLPPLPPPKP